MYNCISCVLYGTLIHYLIILLYVTFMLHNLYVQLRLLCCVWYINSLPYYRVICYNLCYTIYMYNCVSCVLYGTLIHYLIMLLYVTCMLHILYVTLHLLWFIWYINSLPYYLVICYLYVAKSICTIASHVFYMVH